MFSFSKNCLLLFAHSYFCFSPLSRLGIVVWVVPSMITIPFYCFHYGVIVNNILVYLLLIQGAKIASMFSLKQDAVFVLYLGFSKTVQYELLFIWQFNGVVIYCQIIWAITDSTSKNLERSRGEDWRHMHTDQC